MKRENSKEVSANQGLKLHIDVDEEKLTELAKKRRESRINQREQKSYPERFTYTNDVYFHSSDDLVSPTSVELKEFDNELYGVPELIEDESAPTAEMSANKSSLEADDDCLKIDIELVPEKKVKASIPSSPSVASSLGHHRSSRTSLTSIKSFLQGNYAAKYNNDLYGLVEESEDGSGKGGHEAKNGKDTVTNVHDENALSVVEKPSKKRRRTEFEIYVSPQLAASLAENQDKNFIEKI